MDLKIFVVKTNYEKIKIFIRKTWVGIKFKDWLGKIITLNENEHELRDDKNIYHIQTGQPMKVQSLGNVREIDIMVESLEDVLVSAYNKDEEQQIIDNRFI